MAPPWGCARAGTPDEEVDALRRRVAELQQQLAELQEAHEAAAAEAEVAMARQRAQAAAEVQELQVGLGWVGGAAVYNCLVPL